MGQDFDPRILGFLCNWCGYAGADMAGTSRIQYPPNIRIIRVMCSGRIDPTMILAGLRMGADGVLVVGCHPGDCHYVKGNYRTERRVHLLKRMLADMGYDPSRLRLEWVSASEGEKFGTVIRNFTEQLKKIGPNPVMKEVYES
jgi:F420-non-reducing hydrogenase iron-sulfur subunit